MKELIKSSLVATCLLLSGFAQAKVYLPKFFSDNMVLQREMPVRI